mgnify:FL=1
MLNWNIHLFCYIFIINKQVMKINKYSLALISIFISSTSLFFAYFFEYFYTLLPCDLCSKQRGVLFTILIVSLISLICIKLDKNFRFFNKPLILLWASSSTLSIYHYGIEKNYWEGITSCSSKIDFNKDTLKNILSKDITRCDDVQFELLNLSLAGWNSLISISVFIISVYILYIFTRDEKTYDK